MWEMKQEVREAATTCLQDVCGCIDNRDIQPFVPALIHCINQPGAFYAVFYASFKHFLRIFIPKLMDPIDEVPECIHLLAATTFVQTVDGAALSIVVPLIERAFSEKNTAIIRLTAVVSTHEVSTTL